MDSFGEDLKRRQEELLKQSKDALAIDRKRKDAFQGMIAHPGWKVYKELLNSMVSDRGAVMLSPAGSVDGAVAMEFVKGSMNGLILARDLPVLVIGDVPDASLEDEPE